MSILFKVPRIHLTNLLAANYFSSSDPPPHAHQLPWS